jgi:hypothetical protein
MSVRENQSRGGAFKPETTPVRIRVLTLNHVFKLHSKEIENIFLSIEYGRGT